jgi:hypothetical protein
MNIEKKYWDIWDNITFKTISYHKNFDLVNDDESLITEYCGTISLIRLAEYKPPLLMGEFELSTWNFKLGRKFNANIDKLIKSHKNEFIYTELMNVIKNGNIDVNNFNKIVFVNNIILRPEFRKNGLTEELVELLYREHYATDNAIIALVMPLQNNPTDKEYYFEKKIVEIKLSLQNNREIEFVSSIKYYCLNDLLEKKDVETNEYKLFSVAAKCGFTRIGESYLFQYSPEKTIQRMIEKREYKLKLNS